MDIWSLLIVFLIAQGFFIISIFLFSSRRRKKENLYLAMLVMVFIWFLAEFFTVRNVIKVNLDIFYGTRYGSWFILGPLTFFFYKSVTNKEWNFSAKDGLHLLPFLIISVLIPLFSGQELSSRQIHYGMLAVFDHRPKTVTAFEYLYSTVFYLQFIHLGLYLLLNQKMLRSYSKKLKNEYANINDTIWLYTFNILLIVCLLLASVFLYLLFASDIYRRTLDYIYVLPMGLFIYAVGYRLSGIEWLRPQEKGTRYQFSTLKSQEKLAYAKKLGLLMEAQKPFLQNNLRLNDLALKLDMQSHHLSQLINEHFNCSFFDYVNEYRVKEAKDIIRANPKLTLLQVAFEAGFNNKTSFVNAFKKFEGQTPSVFRRTHIRSLAG